MKNNMLKQAQKLQAQLLEQLRKIKVVGNAGGGMVKIEMDGEQNVLSVKIEPQVFEEKDISMIEDLIVAAVNESKRRAQELAMSEMAKVTGGLGIPPGLI